METFRVIRPGLMTTFQDCGRYYFQRFGVPVSGAMDSVSHFLGNRLLGNDENAVSLEITLIGPTLQCCRDTVVNITGGCVSPSVNGKQVPMWENIFLRAGDVLKFGRRITGCRSYLQVAGGFLAPIVMGSASVYSTAPELFGYAMPTEGDKIYTGEASTELINIIGRRLKNEFIPDYSNIKTLRFIKGPHYQWLTEESTVDLETRQYTLSPDSNRTACLTEGPPLKLIKNADIISQATPMGTIQLTNKGHPVILMADRQTVGGYAKIGVVAAVDMPKAAQLFPGDKFSFIHIPPEEAQNLWAAQEAALRGDIFTESNIINFRTFANNILMDIHIEKKRKGDIDD